MDLSTSQESVLPPGFFENVELVPLTSREEIELLTELGLFDACTVSGILFTIFIRCASDRLKL